MKEGSNLFQSFFGRNFLRFTSLGISPRSDINSFHSCVLRTCQFDLTLEGEKHVVYYYFSDLIRVLI